MSDKLVTIAIFDTLVTANIAKDQLEDKGVRAVLADAAAVGVAWHLTSAIGGIKLQVTDKDTERAISILEDRDTISTEDGESLSDEVTEGLERDIDEGYEDEHESPTDEIIDRALRSAFLGLIFLPLQFYSAWLLLRMAWDRDPLSSANRRRVMMTVILDAWIIVCFVFLLSILRMSGGHRI